MIGLLRRRNCERPMRLVLYTDADDIGGVELSMCNLVAHLDDAIEVAVVGTSAEIVSAVVASRPAARPMIVPPRRATFDRSSLRAHLRAMRSLRPDICQLNLRDPYTCGYGFLAGLLTPGVRLVAVEHLPIPTDSRRQHLVKNLQSRLLAAHVAVGEASARYVEEFVGLPSGSVIPIPNGVPTPTRHPVHRLAAGPVVGAVGRFHPQKGFDLLIEAVAPLDGVTLVLVGDGPERARLVELAEAEGMRDRLVLTGWTRDVGSYLAGFDVFALPSRFEGLPLSIIEAMLVGLPVVSTRVGSVAEAVAHERTGLLVSPEDVLSLRAAIARLIADDDLRETMGRRGEEYARAHLGAEAMTRSYESLYERLCRERF
jgi:glycosyltransferase involved in cell wall biosynthesis